MKILKLKTKNINSLKGENEIDFSQANFQNRIFAIVGATGAGKSTILDAISLALYAQTTRLKKDVHHLITKQCSDSFSEVIFEINKKIYRSYFSQKIENGEVTKTMSLYQDQKLLTSGIQEVTTKVTELIGFDFKQFNHSIVLSQGLFDVFLKADEKERASLLERITDTQIYATISKEVYQRAKREKETFQRMDLALRNLISIEPDRRKEMERRKRVLEQERNSYKLDKIIHTIGQKMAFEKLEKDTQIYKDKLEKLQNELVEKQALEREYMDFIHFSREAKNNINQAKLLDRELEFIEKNFKTLEEEIKQTDKILQEIEKNIEDNENKLSQLSVQRTLLQKELHSFANMEHLKQNYSLIASKFHEKNRYQEELNRLKSEKIIEVDANSLEISIRNMEKNLSILHQKIKIQNIEKVEQENLILEKQIIKLIRKETLNKKQDELSKEKEDIELKIENFQKEKKSLQSELSDLKSMIIQLEEKRLLEKKIIDYKKDREELKPNTPCPLCGSLEHPLFSENLQPDETLKLINEKKDRIEEIQKEYNNSEKELVKLESKLEYLLNAMLEHKKELMHLRDTKGDIEKLKEEQKQYSKQLYSVKYQREEMAMIKSKIAKSKEELSEIRVQIQKNNTKRKREEQLAIQIQELSYYLIKTIRMYNIELNNTTLTQLEEKRKVFDEKAKRLNTIELQMNPIEANNIQEKAKRTYVEETLISLKKRASTQKCDLILLKQKRFAVLGDKDTLKYLEEIDKKESHKKENFETFNKLKNQLNHKKALYFSSIEKLEGQQKLKLVDLNTLENQKRVIQEQVEKISQELGVIKNELSLDDERIKKMEKEKHGLDRQEEIYKEWSRLNEIIGSNNGEKYQIFAQRLILSSLISIANQYLEKLNRRYLLALKDDNSLNFEVIDAYQIKSRRDVHTLSGGESFIVSLALSLALLDLNSNQIEINTLFLDEGFETLDEESLEMVISTLNSLENSDKIIGIISHIPILKEQIKTQIKIDKIGNGVSELSIV